MMMKMSMVPLLDIPTGGRQSINLLNPWWPKDKVVIIMGATGTGKSKLSIDISTRFPAEIINSDKMQVHVGLDIVTNKITSQERGNIPHHLLGIIDPNVDFCATDFCNTASFFVNSISSRGRLPVIVGGSNSYIEALIDHKFLSNYECCFLCVDVAMPVLRRSISDRVEKMLENGMVEEARNFFKPNSDYSKGIRKAIGVPEFDRYFRSENYAGEEKRRKLLQEAIDEIKENTCKLAYKQLGKIRRLENVKRWKIHRLDATDVFLQSGEESDEAWEELVAAPAAMIVRRFLCNVNSGDLSPEMRVSGIGNVVAASYR